MKKIFFIAFVTLFVSNAFSQDVLHIKKDNKTYKCKVLEVDSVKVYFKKLNDPANKRFSVTKSKLTKIVYENGKTVTFGTTATQTAKSELAEGENHNKAPENTKLLKAEEPLIPENAESKSQTANTEEHHETKPHKNNSFAIGTRLVNPLGDLGDIIGLGLGGQLSFDLEVSKSIALTGSFGFTKHKYKGDTAYTGSAVLSPMQLGLRYYTGEKLTGFYPELFVGVMKIRDNVLAYTDPAGATTPLPASLKTNLFHVGLALGYKIESLNIRLAYETFTTNANPTATETEPSNYVSFSLLLDILKSGQKAASGGSSAH